MSENDSPEDAQDTTEETAENDGAKTVLYCKTRAALRAEDLRAIKNALGEEGYSLVPSEDGSKVMIQREQEEDKSDVVADVLA